MQNTRLNNLVDNWIAGAEGWLRNPWRRLSVVIISLLLGNFLATALATVAGQRAELDIIIAGLLVVLIELINRIHYGGSVELRRSLLVQNLNAIKIGLMYGFFVEAFKLGS
ncbi:DUF565 domain-containing protein [Pantanalinema rosaneae CENA516]|uniref:DUF565 domain-containing protein n=1 Tax=Pantanalinema rosaneae TaxID=1620701 RepID=UPI003D6E8FEE